MKISKRDAASILTAGKELFDFIEAKDTAARNAVRKFRRDARDYATGSWQTTEDRAWEVLSDELFAALYLAVDEGLIEHQTDLEMQLCHPSAVTAVLAKMPVIR